LIIGEVASESFGAGAFAIPAEWTNSRIPRPDFRHAEWHMRRVAGILTGRLCVSNV
jgi:hypothetical protein